MLEVFRRVGVQLARLGLISSHSGNMSIRTGQGLLITRRGAMLADLREGDLVEAPLEGEVPEASRELPVHQAIYRETEAEAVLHCHPPHAIVLSLHLQRIRPVDAEGRHLLGEVPVLTFSETVGSQEVAKGMPPHLRTHRVVMVRGHGSFAIGRDLEEALMVSSSLEASARVLWLGLVLQRPLG